jgi:hypothetical protein
MIMAVQRRPRRSSRFRQLENNIEKIEEHLLPQYRILGNYTNEEHCKIRSYILLVHAELESYLEDRAEELVLYSYRQWQTNGTANTVLLSLVAFTQIDHKAIPSDIPDDTVLLIDGRIEAVVRTFMAYIKDQNHGIKKHNILSVLLPIGIKHNDIDDAWLGTIDSFGHERGNAAHKSLGVQIIFDPMAEKNKVDQILLELSNLDVKLSSLK